MNRHILPVIAVLALAMLPACHPATDRAKTAIERDFQVRVTELPEWCTEVFADSADMEAEMLDALKFLYAYMPLPDITDYPGSYHRDNVEVTLQAREEMPWGAAVPEREWRHFVLPVRVNNEDLDGHRRVFYNELKDRVAGMSMAEAILEVNHWCHEHATYQPSDSRTHSPLATVSSAIGRCGEESTLTVAALRSVGIPARQVYTPRWAHTDDNHAWVEAWADGEWHFLGACEPEAVLDLGWFNAPAARGMMMNTRVLGRYDGPEERLVEADRYTDINVTCNYAPVDTVTVCVVDATGAAIEGATVDFRLYNYAELYPIATKTTAADGEASLVAGLGDLVVWAAYDGQYAYRQVSVGRDRDIEMVIGGEASPTRCDMLLVPPVATERTVQVPDDMAAANACRLAYEDSVRTAYTATFGTDPARGNAQTIKDFLEALPAERQSLAERMLASFSQKDLTDVSLEVLTDAFTSVDRYQRDWSDFDVSYVLSPRVYTEFLVPVREELPSQIPDSLVASYRNDPALWAQWVRDSIATDRQWQPERVIMGAKSVHRLRHTNALSRDVYFVATARAMGIPARYEAVTGRAQYYKNGGWCDLVPKDGNAAVTPTSTLRLTYPGGMVKDPGYYYHFTISRIDGGRPDLLEYSEEATWSADFAKGVSVDQGEYMLVTGQRQADGSVLTHVEMFEIAPGETTVVPLVMRQDGDGVKVIGTFDSESRYLPLGATETVSVLSTTGRGYYILGLLGAKDEPSVHAMRDLLAKKDELAATGIPIVLLFADEAEAKACELLPQLSAIAAIGTDPDGTIRQALSAMPGDTGVLPRIIIADTFNRVVYRTSGYTISLGQSLADTLARLR